MIEKPGAGYKMLWQISKYPIRTLDKCNANVIQWYCKGGGGMSMDATLQVRMDAEMKERVEKLYRSMGTTFAEAVRMMAAQSLIENGMSFKATANGNRAFGIASARANSERISMEKDAFERAMVTKHATD